MAGSGLLSIGGSGVAPTGFTPGEGDDMEEVPNVSPEEQQEYETFVNNGMQIIYKEDGTVEPQVLQRLSTGKKRIDTLAQTAVWLVMALEQSAKKQGRPISDDVLMHGGKELMEQLVDVVEAAGLHTFKEAEQQGAWYQALDLYREANSDEGDRINKDEAAAAFEALNEADKEGRADEVVPGFYQQAERGIARAVQDGAPVQEEDLVGGEEKTLNRKNRGG